MNGQQRRWLTAELPGTGGRFDPTPETFFVEELPLYDACGQGDHLYIRVEKRDLTTRQLVRRCIEVFGVDERDVGYAGLKDRHATTIQTVSVPGVQPGDAARIEDERIRVVDARRHGNKLRTGHLRANRFRAHVGDAGPGAADRARAILSVLEERGLPSYYGEQRFGADGENVEQALQVLRRGPRAAGGSRWKARLLVSALQSQLFNDYLTARMDAGSQATVVLGDVLLKEASGGRFTCSDPTTDQARHDRWEVSITGPMFGPKMHVPAEGSAPAAWEDAVLQAAGLSHDDFRRAGKLGEGTRRPLRARVTSAGVEQGSDGSLLVSFELPAGAYATVLMGEVVKGEGRGSSTGAPGPGD